MLRFFTLSLVITLGAIVCRGSNTELGPLEFFIPGPNDTICKGDTANLTATNPLALSYSWSPSYNITNTTISNPKVYPDTTTTYYVTISGITNNLIVNGNFSQGNVGFTSSYTYTTNLWPEATYCIGTNPTTFHSNFASCGDHTTGNGNMMVVNAAGTPNTTIWQQNVNVIPNSNYVFSCWLTSVHSSSPAQLQFFVNNVQIGPVFQATATTCNWNMFYNTWFSGPSTTATITIKNQNTALSGNDFAIDDLYFAQVVNIVDSTLIVVENPKVSLGNDTSICVNDTVQLDAGTGFAQYQWSTGATSQSIAVSTPGNFWVRATTGQGCRAYDTLQVTMLPLPALSVTHDTVCLGDSALLSVITDPGNIIHWSNGAVTSTVQLFPSTNSTLQVMVTDSHGCSDTASATVIVNPLPVVQVSSDTTVCSGAAVNLSASGGISYNWAPVPGNTPVIAVVPAGPSSTYTVTVTDANQCSDTASVTVSTLDYPVINVSVGSDTLCRGGSTNLTASGGSSFNWSTGDNTAGITISPVNTSIYQVTVTNVSGTASCSSDTLIRIVVRNCIVLYVPNAMSLTGTNNYFKPIGDLHESFIYSLSIFDRWGNLVFNTSDFNEAWDGRFRGQLVGEGAYVFYIIIDDGSGKPYQRQGTLTVLR